MGFGVESIAAALGRRMVVVEPGEVQDDLVQNLIESLTSFLPPARAPGGLEPSQKSPGGH